MISVVKKTALFLALIPKCPFCIFAYSSTIVLCSGTHTEYNNSPITIFITSLFCTFVLGSILLNFRGRRTYMALALAAFASSIVIYSVAVEGGEILYYFGIILMFFGIWLNGSFLWFYNKIRNQKSTLDSPKVTNTFIQKNSNL